MTHLSNHSQMFNKDFLSSNTLSLKKHMWIICFVFCILFFACNGCGVKAAPTPLIKDDVLISPASPFQLEVKRRAQAREEMLKKPDTAAAPQAAVTSKPTPTVSVTPALATLGSVTSTPAAGNTTKPTQ